MGSNISRGKYPSFPGYLHINSLEILGSMQASMMSMCHVLNLAIKCNMKFHMAMKIGDLKVFHPKFTPVLSELPGRMYKAGFQEKHLRDINGGETSTWEN